MTKTIVTKEIIDLAKMVTMYEPRVSILDEGLYNQYLLNIQAIDYCLKEKLKLKKLSLPELRTHGNETIAIYSDYGGEHSASKYLTYSFLVCGWNHAYGFPEIMIDIREKYQLEEKEISFKDLEFGPINRSLDEYLTALHNWVPGMLVTFVVNKKIQSFFGEKLPDDVSKTIAESGFGKWKPHVLEKLIRIVHTASYLVALLSKDGQKIYWTTDNDAIVANESKKESFINLFDSVLSLYTNNKFDHIGYSTEFKDKNLKQLDFLSSVDLAAGAIEHYFTNSQVPPFKMKNGTEKILKWLSHDGISLKKLTVLIDKKENGNISFEEVAFKTDAGNKDQTAILVPTKYP